jgi:signal recognition particle subunit SRP19
VIYPIYLDAKAPYGRARRVPRAHALWWPLSADLAAAAQRLGVRCAHEADKTHPRDWANPGRVRVVCAPGTTSPCRPPPPREARAY